MTQEKLNKQAFTKIALKTEYCENTFFIKAVPYEIYFLLQNLIKNAVDATLITKEKTENPQIIIKTRTEGSKGILTISDTGPGFTKINSKGEVNINQIKSKKGSKGGFGLKYSQAIMGKYGAIKIRNRQGRQGAEIKLTFKLTTFLPPTVENLNV